MKTFRHYGLIGTLLLLAAPAAAGARDGDDEGSPLDLLSNKGLKVAGKYFVIDKEADFIQAVVKMQPVMAEMQSKYAVWAGIHQNEYEFQYLTDLQLSLQGQVNDQNGVIRKIESMNAKAPLERMEKEQMLNNARGYGQQLSQNLRDTNTQVELRRKRLVFPREKEKAEKDFKDVRGRFLAAAAAARPLWDEILDKYNTLKEDGSVQNAIKAHVRASKANIKLGPSDKAFKARDLIKNTEANYSPETFEPSVPKPGRGSGKGSKKTR